MISAKCFDSTPCTVCFLLSSCSTFNGMYCSCYCCAVIVVVTLLTVLSLFALRTLVSSRLFPLLSVVSSHVFLYARVILFSFCLLRPRLSISLRSSVFSRDGSHLKLPDPLVLGDYASCSRGSFEVDYQSISRDGPFQSI